MRPALWWRTVSNKNPFHVGIAYALAASMLYGIAYIFVKRIVDEVSVFTLLSGRFTLAFAIMSVLMLTGTLKINFKNKSLKKLMLIAFFSPILYFVLETLGVKLTTASETATITACIPITTMLLSTAILKESPTKRQAISIVGSVAGVIIVMLAKGMSAAFSPLGYFLLAIGVLADSMCAVLTRKYAEFTASERTFMMTLLGAVVFTAVAVAEHVRGGTLAEFIALPLANKEFLIAILYLGGACSVAGTMLARISIAKVGANRYISFVGVSTITSVSAGIVLLKEPFTWLQGVGTLLIIAGVYAANSRWALGETPPGKV